MKLIYVLPLVLSLAACASHEPDSRAVLAEPVVVSKSSPERIKSQPLKYLLGHTHKPIPDHALEVRTKCTFHDVAGGRGAMDLQVTKAEVKRFVAEVNIPKQGLCRFNMNSFRQTSRLPNVVLTDNESSCVVRMWEQEKGVTVAFNSCQEKCSGDAYSYLWPILINTSNGRCS